MPRSFEKCYPSGGNTIMMIAGYALVIVGIILLFVCIPYWAWLALLGVGLMIAGVLLLRISKAWR